MKHFISSLSVINANPAPCEGRVSSRKILSLLLILFLSIGNVWAESESVTFTNKDWAPWTKITSGSSFESASSSRGVANNGVNGSCKSSKSYSNITKISYVASSNTTGGKVTIKVGETTVGETSIPKENNQTFEYAVDNLSGVITLSVTKPTSKTVYVKSITIETSVATPEPEATLISIAHTGDKTTFTEGDAFVKSEITATYDDATTKDVTSLATFTGYNMNTTGTQTVNVEYEGKTTAYDITVNPKPTYTITWNNAGSTTPTTVKQGEALGELPTVADCPNGKKFMGWTAATSVNSDGTGITYIKSTDKPTVNTTYYAVFAVVEGGESTSTTVTQSIKTYAEEISWTSGTKYNTMNIDANITATATGGGNTGKYYSTGDGTWRFYQNETPSLTISTASGYEIQTIKITYAISNTGILTLDGSNVSSGTVCEVNAESVIFGVGNTGSATNGQAQVSAIEVVYAPAAKKTDYSLNCDIHQDPYLTLLETEINFGTVAQDATVTETLNVSGGYLAEDVTLTISGTDASFFSVNPTTIAKADEIDQNVTISYNPTATGDHTATLTIKTGDMTKTVALSGTVLAPGKWALVKDVATLSAGDEIIIAAANADYAIGEAASNNYKGAAITKVGETANADASVTVLTIEETGVAEAPYALKDGSKYLYAAGSDKNYLRAQATNNENGQWTVTITAEGVASIVAAKSTNRNVMQCNPNNGSPIFACYSSADYEALAIYRNSENVVKPVVSGEADFVGSTQVTITAQSGLTVYYTTDGTDPDNTSTQYTAPFTINATTTVKAIAYDASSNASGVAEMTFTKHELVNVATAMALEKDKIAYFAEFEVVKVVTGKGNIYIKDASGHGLIYDNTLAGELKDGDRVQGFVGVSSPYNGLPEAKPYNVTYAGLKITAGTPAEPYDFTSTAIASTDINKYVVFNDVEIATAVSMSNSNKEFSLTINGSNVAFYNQFSIEKTLEAGKTYDIYGFVSIYNEKLQVYFYQALEEDEVVTKYTVTYNAGGATGEVPIDDNEYTKGAQVYLKSATGLTKEGYDYKGWKVTDEGGNEIAVSSNKFNMPASNVTVTAQWEEIVVTPVQDFSNGYWVLVTEEGQLAVGDKIVVAAVEEDYAMKSYESGNNIKHLAITKLGDKRFLKWTSEVGVFQLASSGSGYTIQDVNTEEYLYAAGSSDNNHLKATDEVPSDAAAAKPYIWTISYTDGVATVKATSDNHNDLQYNKSADLFSCYASTQGKIALYKHVDNIDPTLVTPTIVANSYFSVADGKFVQFSTGNLQYEVGTNTWSFAENQYEVIGGEAYTGSNNTNYGMNEPGYTGKLDLFAWSCDGKFGVNPSNADADYTGAFADWGNLVNETGWYTLTKDEMTYILNRKKDGKKLWALATVCGMNGLILLPDNWNTSTTLEYGYIPADWNYTKNQLDAAAWAGLEAAGAVFLPEGGTRVGGHGNKDQGGGPAEFDAHGDYFHVDNVGEMGYYWLNSTTSEKADYLILPGWSNNGTPTDESDDKALAPQVWSREKRRGNSVRLVKEVTPDSYYTRTVTSGDYGTICLPNGGLLLGASAFSVAKMEGTTIFLDEVGTTMVGGTPYVVFPNTGASNLYVFYTDNVDAPAGNANGLYGSYTREELAPNAGNYIMLPGNRYAEVTGDRVYVAANRAYFRVGEISTIAPAPAPGVRRIAIGQAPQVATGMESVDASAQPVKMIIDGQLYILRGEKMYDAQGKLVK